MAVPLLSAGCSVGGSKGNGPTVPTASAPPPPTATKQTFAEALQKPNATIDVMGLFRAVRVGQNPQTGGIGSVSDLNSQQMSGSVTTDGNSKLSSLTINDGVTKHTWDASNSSLAEGGGFLMATKNSAGGSETAIVADPQKKGFAHQTYGAWIVDRGTSGDIGSFSVGSPTEVANIPTSGSATFKGTAGGLYGEAGGKGAPVTADASLNADFANKSLTFNTTNTVAAATGAARNDLNLSGNMSYAAGAMAGSVKNTANTMSGTVQGQFYGPTANEVGGVFSLTSAAPGKVFVGGYGAARQ